MKRLRLFALLIALPVAAANAQAVDWTHAQRIEVKLSSFDFRPSTLHLHSGRPAVLHLVNTGSGGHDFTAPAFFAAASCAPRTGDLSAREASTCAVTRASTSRSSPRRAIMR